MPRNELSVTNLDPHVWVDEAIQYYDDNYVAEFLAGETRDYPTLPGVDLEFLEAISYVA